MSHTVAAIQFIRRTDDGPCTCECGWSGLASEFGLHRKLVGARQASSTIGPRTVDPKTWNRQYTSPR